MKKTLSIIAVVAASLTIGASIAVANTRHFDYLIATDNTRNASIVLDASTVTVTDDESSPYQVYFDISTTTQSLFPFTANGCTAGATKAIDFKKTIDTKTYMFCAEGYSGGGAWFTIDLSLENLYSFSNVVVDGLFTDNDDHVTYQYTYTSSDTSVVDWDSSLGWALIYIRSNLMDNNYKTAFIEKITVNYTCLK